MSQTSNHEPETCTAYEHESAHEQYERWLWERFNLTLTDLDAMSPAEREAFEDRVFQIGWDESFAAVNAADAEAFDAIYDRDRFEAELAARLAATVDAEEFPF